MNDLATDLAGMQEQAYALFRHVAETQFATSALQEQAARLAADTAVILEEDRAAKDAEARASILKASGPGRGPCAHTCVAEDGRRTSRLAGAQARTALGHAPPPHVALTGPSAASCSSFPRRWRKRRRAWASRFSSWRPSFWHQTPCFQRQRPSSTNCCLQQGRWMELLDGCVRSDGRSRLRCRACHRPARVRVRLPGRIGRPC